jgi:hypothetical protein
MSLHGLIPLGKASRSLVDPSLRIGSYARREGRTKCRGHGAQWPTKSAVNTHQPDLRFVVAIEEICD